METSIVSFSFFFYFFLFTLTSKGIYRVPSRSIENVSRRERQEKKKKEEGGDRIWGNR